MTEVQNNLVLTHMHIADLGAKRYARGGAMALTYDDYLSSAYYGLVRAALAYDPDKGTFGTYAYYHVEAWLKKARREAMRGLGWASKPTLAEQAGGHVGMPRRAVVTSAPTWLDNIPAPVPDKPDLTPIYAVCRTDRERDVIRRRCDDQDYRVIGAAYGLTWQRIHQIEKKILDRAKTRLEQPARYRYAERLRQRYPN